MTEITASMVKKLRERSGAGMMDCKKALSETSGNIEEAVDWLRKKGLSAAVKKSNRITREGLVGVISEGKRGAIVEVNAETDFVARNEIFQNFVTEVTKIVLQVGGDLEQIKEQPYLGSGRTVAEELTNMVAMIGENISIRRASIIEVSEGVVANYVHGTLRPGLGQIGVLVALSGNNDKASLEILARQIGMHVAATSPEAIGVEALDPILVARERAVIEEQVNALGRPAEIMTKMIEGRLRKYYEEVVLLEQTWIHDGQTRVKKIMANAGVVIEGFVRFRLGEGVEKAEAADSGAEVTVTSGIK